MSESTYYIEHKKPKNILYGWFGSVVFHGCLFLALYFFVMTPPDPPWEEQGSMQMILGEDDFGGPNPEPVEKPQANEIHTPIETQDDQPDEIVQDIEEVNITSKKPEKKVGKTLKPIVVTKKTEKKHVLELPQKINQSALFRKSNNAKNNESGFGDGQIPGGNQGDPNGSENGDPNGKGDGSGGNGTSGTGSGNGSNFWLEGRKVLYKPKITDESKGIGVVYVSIVVNREGRVTKAVPGQRGSTTIDSQKLEKAKQIALDLKYSTRNDGPDEQFGTIKINFSY